MQNKWILLVLITISSLVLAGCQSSASAAATPAAPAAPTGMIVQGHIEPVQYTDLSFLSPGQVAEVLVKEGDTVQAGQVIATLTGKEVGAADLARAEQEVLAAEQALADLRGQAYPSAAQANAAVVNAGKAVKDAEERLKTLKEDKAALVDIEQAEAQVALAKATLWSAKKQFDGLKNGLDLDQEAALLARANTAKTALTRAQYSLDTLELRAPNAGVVTSVAVKAGQFTPAGQPALTIADFSKWVAKTDDLTELEVVQVKVGEPVEIILDALASAPMTGKVTQVASQYEEKRGDVTYTVTIEIDNPNPSARWGMTGQVIFKQGQ